MTSIQSIRRNRVALIGNLLLAVFGCGVCMQLTAGEPPVIYSSIPAVDCVINPYQVADLASPVPGVIEKLHVERSQQVSAGDVVAQLDAGVERAGVELARYRAGIQSEINVGQVNLDYDKRRQQRIDSLFEKKVISVENTDEAEREADLSRWKLEQAVELANIRKLELQRAREQLRQKSIRAPFDGFVLDTFKYRGEYVEDQAILRLAQLDPLVVEAIVPMENFGEIKPGMIAEIVPEFVSAQKLKATVTIVDRIGDTASNTFGVRLVLPNPDNRIPAGLKCVVKFLQQTEEYPIPLTTAERTHEQSPPQTVTEWAEETSVVTVSLKEDLQAKNFSATEHPAPAQSGEKPDRYLVISDCCETSQQTRELVDGLADAGIRDFQEVYRGSYKGRVMLGLYNKPGNAEKRQKSLTQLGFTAFVEKLD